MSAPLRCHSPEHAISSHAPSAREQITVEEARQMLRRDGRKELRAYCRCEVCGWVWWSSHKDALARSRKAEAKHKRGGKP